MDVANTVGTWLGVVVGVLGFGLTLYQLVRARRSLERSERRLRINQLAMLVPQLTSCEQEVRRAVQASNSEASSAALTRWRHLAAQLAGVTAGESSSGDLMNQARLAAALRRAAAKAADAEQALAGGQSPAQATVEASKAVARATLLANEAAARLQSYTEDR